MEMPTAMTMMAAPAASLEQRVRRFADEDATTFVACSTLCTGLYAALEFRKTAAAAASISALKPSTAHRLRRALRKTLPIVPAIVLSSAVGIIGMKVTLAAVQDARRDYSRTSVLISVPLFAALIHAPAGPRAMAKSAIGYGAFILAADFAASEWHHYNAMKLEMEHEMAHTQAYDPEHHLHHAFADHGADHGSPFGRSVAPVYSRPTTEQIRTVF